MFWRLPDDCFCSKKHILNWNWHELSGCYDVVQVQVSRSSANTTFGFLSKHSSSRFREITSSFALNLKISTALRSGWLVIFMLPQKTATLRFHWELDPKVWTLRGVPSVMLWTSSLIEGMWSMVSNTIFILKDGNEMLIPNAINISGSNLSMWHSFSCPNLTPAGTPSRGTPTAGV